MKPRIYLPSGGDLQDAVDWCKRTDTAEWTIILAAGGEYELSDTVIIDGGISLSIIGETPCFLGLGPQTAKVSTTFNDKPAFILQSARACHFQDFEVIGQNDFGPLSDFNDLVDDSFFLLSGVRNNRYSPHCAFALDPFINGNPGGSAANRYPGLEPHYSGSPAASSFCTWRRVHPSKFNVGFMNSPSGDGNMLNGENHLFHQCQGSLNTVFYASGQHQTKNVVLDNCMSYGGQYFVDCRRYGLQLGYPPVIRGGNVGGTQRLFNTVQGYPFTCTDVFMESSLSLGTIGYGGMSAPTAATFRGCQFHFWIPDREQVDAHLYNFIPVSFEGCVLGANSAGNGELFRLFNNSPVSLHNTYVGFFSNNGTPQLSYHREDLVSATNLSYTDPSTGVVYKTFPSVSWNTTAVGTATLSYISGDRGTFTLPGHGLSIGDKVFATTPISAYKPRAHLAIGGGNGNIWYASDLPIGTVSNVSGDTVTLIRLTETLIPLLPLSITMERRIAA